MNDVDTTAQTRKSVAAQLVFWLSVFFVILGMINAMPGIPGLDQLAADLAGNDDFIIRKFPFQYYYPFAFALMMIIVAL